jgi:hypothetical protein
VKGERVLVPLFEMVDCPTFRIQDIKDRRYWNDGSVWAIEEVIGEETQEVATEEEGKEGLEVSVRDRD